MDHCFLLFDNSLFPDHIQEVIADITPDTDVADPIRKVQKVPQDTKSLLETALQNSMKEIIPMMDTIEMKNIQRRIRKSIFLGNQVKAAEEKALNMTKNLKVAREQVTLIVTQIIAQVAIVVEKAVAVTVL